MPKFASHVAGPNPVMLVVMLTIMNTEDQIEDLVDTLGAALSEYRYTERETGELDNIPFIARLMTPRRRTTRYICAISRVPRNVRDLPACRRFFEDTRTCLRKQYACFPWWKELGTYSVILCGAQQFQDLSGDFGAFKDRTGLHMNVMLGTCFIDIENFKSSADSTWGLYYSGKHFGAVREAVRQWCQQCDAETQSA